MSHAIPLPIRGKHRAYLGMTGSGKTSSAKKDIEEVLDDTPAARVCVLDTIKSDWWGMTAGRDGKKGGYPFHIIGGPHGHVPLHAKAGKAIGEVVATGALQLSIIDMANFGPGDLQGFFIDFSQSLMRNMKGVLYLVIEEAHMVAPKERPGFKGENMALHYAIKLASAGRSKGVRMLVCTQRVQKLHNDILGSCSALLAHRLMFPADIKKAPAPVPTKPIPAPIVKGWAPGKVKALVKSELRKRDAWWSEQHGKTLEQANQWCKSLERIAGIIPGKDTLVPLAKMVPPAIPDVLPEVPDGPVVTSTPVHGFTPKLIPKGMQPVAQNGNYVIGVDMGITAGADGSLKPAFARLLEAVKWYQMIGIMNPTESQLAFKLGYSAGSSTTGALISRARKHGWMNARDRALTSTRHSAVPDPHAPGSLRDFHETIRSVIAGSERKAFDVMLAVHPQELTAQQICERVSPPWSVESSTLGAALSRLRKMELVEPRGHRLSPLVFPEALR